MIMTLCLIYVSFVSFVFTDLKFLFLVGGFAESATLQYEVRKEFSAILKVLIPTGVSLAILKGTPAHNPQMKQGQHSITHYKSMLPM